MAHSKAETTSLFVLYILLIAGIGANIIMALQSHGIHGEVFGINVTLNHVMIFGLALGMLFVLIRVSMGSNFQRAVMLWHFITSFGLLLIIGSFLFSQVNYDLSGLKVGGRNGNPGQIIFIASALLPLVLYGAVGALVSRFKAPKK